MAYRRLLTLTAVISSLIGAVMVYLLFSIPNDLKSDTLLKEARHELEKGERDKARQSLSRIVQQYPRTDAAAAATIALLTISDQDVRELRSELTRVKADHVDERKQINALTKQVSDVPNLVAAAVPPPATPEAKAAPTPPETKKRRFTTRRRPRTTAAGVITDRARCRERRTWERAAPAETPRSRIRTDRPLPTRAGGAVPAQPFVIDPSPS